MGESVFVGQGNDRQKGVEKPKYQTPKARFIPIVIDGKLAFKFDPHRGLIEWQNRGEKYIIDLATICTD
jgi:hypothetical protein